jgi:hypothetical protein
MVYSGYAKREWTEMDTFKTNLLQFFHKICPFGKVLDRLRQIGVSSGVLRYGFAKKRKYIIEIKII